MRSKASRWVLVGSVSIGTVAQVPGEVAGEHADQHVGFDALFEAVVDGPQVQVVGLEVAEVPLDVFEVLVSGDHAGTVQVACRDGGAQHVEPVQGGLGVDLVLLAGQGEAVIGDGDLEVLAGLVLAQVYRNYVSNYGFCARVPTVNRMT